MAASDDSRQTAIVVGTSIVTFLTGFLLGVWSIQGYLISPSLVEERRRNLHDPVESDESDVDENDTLLDHAPNWANGPQADRKQGLSASAGIKDNGEECKLVLVVRTDLGMTKGRSPQLYLDLCLGVNMY
jgi:peptidyl-tRNA hydrolase, PTH2 family